MPEPRRSWLRQLLDRPDARGRVKRAVAGLLGAEVVGIGAVGALVVWHLVRRGRLIRERLGPPKVVRLPEVTAEPPSPPDESRPS